MRKSRQTKWAKTLFSIAVLISISSSVIAGDDNDLAVELYAQAKIKGQENGVLAEKMREAAARGDMIAVCSYAREGYSINQQAYGLAMRMTRLDLDPHNADVARGLLDVSRASVESAKALLDLPECAQPPAPVYNYQNNRDMNGLNVGVAQAREADAEGNLAFAAGRWSDACLSFQQAQQWYRFNSGFALKVAEGFTAKSNPQPQLAPLSAELAGLERAAIPKRDQACENERFGDGMTKTTISAKDRADIAAMDKALGQQQALIDQFYSAKANGKMDVACSIITKIITGQNALMAQSTSLQARYDTPPFRKDHEQIIRTLDGANKLKADGCSATTAKP